MLFGARNAMQGSAGMAGWRLQRGGEGMCERVKYCTETPPAAANVAPGKKGELGASLGGRRGGTEKCKQCMQWSVAWHTVTM